MEMFPTSFCFRLTEEEFNNWKSQIVMSDNDKIGLRHLPYVFNEQEVAMLSAIINTDIVVEVFIRIINVFVEIKLLQESFSKKIKYDGIFFAGQIYDSYSLLVDIFNIAKKVLL